MMKKITTNRGVYSRTGKLNLGVGINAIRDVYFGEEYKISGYVYNENYPLILEKNDGEIVGFEKNDLNDTAVEEYYYKVSEGVNNIIVNSSKEAVIEIKKNIIVQTKEYVDKKIKEEIEKDNGYWNGKKIIWFGTSIPAGGYLGLDNPNSYPMIVGKLLGANVINEAVGSSSVCCRKKSQITGENPYGFNTNFEQVSRSLGNTREEMQWVIDNYNASFWTNKPKGGLTEELKAQILKNSYEYKLDRHLGEGNRADLYVFDHGHNEDFWISDANTEPENPFDRSYIQGAFNFIINRILEDDPRARVIMIGEYEKQKNPGIKRIQETCSEYWSLPLMPLWNFTGWSQRKVRTTGFWENGFWQNSGGELREIAILDSWLPDKIHPHTDKSQKANKYLANLIGCWIKNEIR